MNLTIPKRFLLITAVLYILSIVFFIVLNIIQFAPKEIDLYFKTSWVLNQAMLQFFDNLVKIQCTAVLYTFSVFYPKTRSESGMQLLSSRTFNQLITFVIIILLSLTAVFFVGNEVFKPRLHEKVDTFAYLTKTSRAYFEQANKALEDGHLFEAEDDIKRYLAIKPDDPDGTELYETILKRIDNQYVAASQDNTQPSAQKTDNIDLSYNDALRLARTYLAKEDFYSAYYYAQLAAGLSGDAEAAKEISTRAWTELSETAPSTEETAEFTLFSRKKQGTELLLADMPIEAYYLFNQLSIEYPDDPDVKKYLQRSIQETRKLTYFIDEATEALSFPGVSDICFLNTNDETVRELYFFGKMVNLVEGVFFENIEVVRLSPSHRVTSHITAKYGKLIGDHIVLNGIDKENRNIKIYPEYLTSDKLPEIYNTIKLNIDWTHLVGLSTSGSIYKKLNIMELIDLEPVIAGYGWMVEPLYIELITRILNPCSFIILSLLMIAIGWQYRKFEGKIPIGGLVLSPLVIFIVALFSDTYIYGIRLLCTWLFLGFGKIVAMSLLVASQIIIMIAAFLMLAGLGVARKTEHD